MKIIDRYFTDVLLLESDRSTSQEGLQLTWSDQALAELGVDFTFLQDNHSRSKKMCSEGCITKFSIRRESRLECLQGLLSMLWWIYANRQGQLGSLHYLKFLPTRDCWPGFHLVSPMDFMYQATMPMCCTASLIIALQNLNVPCFGQILRYILIGLS